MAALLAFSSFFFAMISLKVIFFFLIQISNSEIKQNFRFRRKYFNDSLESYFPKLIQFSKAVWSERRSFINWWAREVSEKYFDTRWSRLGDREKKKLLENKTRAVQKRKKRAFCFASENSLRWHGWKIFTKTFSIRRRAQVWKYFLIKFS